MTFAQPKDPADYEGFNREVAAAHSEIMRLDRLLRQGIGAHNFLIKVHGTNTGMAAAQRAHAAWANINYTLLHRRAHVLAAMQAHKRGIMACWQRRGEQPALFVQEPAGEARFSDFVSRTDRTIDPMLKDPATLRAHVDRRLTLPSGALGAPAHELQRQRLVGIRAHLDDLLKPGNEGRRDAFVAQQQPLVMKAGVAYTKAEIYPLLKSEYLENAEWLEFQRRSGARTPKFIWGSTGVKVRNAEGKEVYTSRADYFGELTG